MAGSGTAGAVRCADFALVTVVAVYMAVGTEGGLFVGERDPECAIYSTFKFEFGVQWLAGVNINTKCGVGAVIIGDSGRPGYSMEADQDLGFYKGVKTRDYIMVRFRGPRDFRKGL